MQQYDWIQKFFIGLTGTTVSFLLENISTVVSIAAGLLTIIFLIQQIIMVHKSREHFNEIWKFGKEKRDWEREQHEKAKKNN